MSKAVKYAVWVAIVLIPAAVYGLGYLYATLYLRFLGH